MAISKVSALMSSVSNLMATRAMQASQKLGAKVHASSSQTANTIHERSNVPQYGKSQAFKVNISKTGMANFESMQVSNK
ncbi:MAG: hypothetical protein HQL84_15605 [Magnetococcales bacterium]|nr:hypothetical protein [Magnetococcales bacterium]MBF0151446.1 hypothetical protein [Magnetococcales bacterium]MBF0174419.1 hypothetical protein [Magnetococcales bacterium]MBF0348424.1 hypothetical protein [Magnetococcales bacterium]MBF0632460.1 hypothetical protein [Magnetococcales bacterium]